jgi:hypothetical protein
MTFKTVSDLRNEPEAMTDIETLRDQLAEVAEKADAEMKILPLEHVWPLISRLVIAVHYVEPLRRVDAVERFLDDLADFICDARDRLTPGFAERHPSTRRLRSKAPPEPARIGFFATLKDDQE